MPCTTILAGKKATADGSTLISRNEDCGFTFNQKHFVIVKPEDQPTDYTSVTSKVQIKLPDNPMRYSAVPGIASQQKKMGIWGEAGINDANTAMSATETITTNSRVLGIDPLVKKGIGEEDIVTIVLPYIHSAREGVQLLGQYLEKYGTYESNGVAFSDKDEVWYMETIGGHHWAAQRIPDDSYVVAPNWFSITNFDFDSEDTMASADLQSMIDDNHLNTDPTGKYNLRHIFGSHKDSDFRYNVPREWYIQRLFNPSDVEEPDNPDLPFMKKPERLLTVEDVKYALSSRYQRTPYDPYDEKGTAAQRNAFRPVGFQRNAEVHILQVRSDVPAKEAGICWLSFGPNAFNAVAPFYTNVLDTPAEYKNTQTHFDIQNIYWVNQLLATIADGHPRRYQQTLENMVQNVMAAGRRVLRETDPAAAKLDGAELQKALQDANAKTAQAAYKFAMKCLGEMVENGALKLNLNYGNE
ncbi:C69 family dipeptidase [Limosilactobacillus caecicola]|uniref:C69 family dipeptidase n=1 Tax=Limosilactobacillus caecicola TaxID=2941332 RepID=UPI00203AD0DF|nr:C69 family dipeptidase [Limosilactobacillus caecicola]